MRLIPATQPRNVLAGLILCLCLVSPAARGADLPEILDFGGDAFRAGLEARFEGPEVDDLFMAGESVRAESAVSGSVYLAGRRVDVLESVAGDAHAAGATLRFERPIGGDATLAGQSISLGAVGGDLRAAGSEIVLGGPVGGYALITGERVEILGPITGDARITARTLVLGPGARIGGQLTLYEPEPGMIDLPEAVIAPERVTRRQAEEWELSLAPDLEVGFEPAARGGNSAGGFVSGVLIVVVVAALIAALAPERLGLMSARLRTRPFATLGLGFVVLSGLAGATLLLALTLIGLLVAPAVLVVALAAVGLGYVIAAYALGAGLLQAAGRPAPATFGARGLAGLAGALLAALVGLIPVLGWLFGVALVLAGVGAMSRRLLAGRIDALTD